MRWFQQFLGAAVFVLLGMLIFSRVDGAPAPGPRAKPKPKVFSEKNLKGTSWEYDWYGNPWVFTFLPDGHFLDQRPGSASVCWHGTWTTRGDEIILTCEGNYEGLHLQIDLDTHYLVEKMPGTMYHWHNFDPPKKTDGTLRRTKRPPIPDKHVLDSLRGGVGSYRPRVPVPPGGMPIAID
ncbi:MAG: hypothetical protein KGL39_40275 [Patescibacteria group bacterium]|nr:hypothetical protein [Patescibacteria group bacterium]